MGGRVELVVLIVALFILWGFIPANVDLRKAKKSNGKYKVPLLKKKDSPRVINVGRYVYRIALRDEERREKDRHMESFSNVVNKIQSRKKNHLIFFRLVIGGLLLVVLGVISIRFYVVGRKLFDLSSRNAFSFIELVITLAIFTLVISAISSLLFSTRPFFTACEQKITELNDARRVQLYLEKILSRACEQGTDVVKIYSNKIVFPYCTVEAGNQVVAGYGKIRFDGNHILVDEVGNGQEHLLAQDISSWQVVRDGDKIQIQYKFGEGGSYRFQVALMTD